MDVLFRSIVLADKAPQVCEVLNKFKWYAIDGDRCRVGGVYAHDLCLCGVDIQTCLFCIITN